MAISGLLFTLASAASTDSDRSLNGRGIYSEFQQDHYLAEIYVETPASSSEELVVSDNIEMRLTLLADSWSKRRLTQYWNQAILINNPGEQRKKYSPVTMAWLDSIKAPLKRGDELRFLKSDGKFIFSINEIELMTSSKTGAFNLLLNTWVGARPPSSEFRAGVLGLSETTDAIKKYTGQGRSDSFKSRQLAIKEWKDLDEKDKEIDSSQLASVTPPASKEANAVVTTSPAKVAASGKTVVNSTPTTNKKSVAATEPATAKKPLPRKPDATTTAVLANTENAVESPTNKVNTKSTVTNATSSSIAASTTTTKTTTTTKANATADSTKTAAATNSSSSEAVVTNADSALKPAQENTIPAAAANMNQPAENSLALNTPAPEQQAVAAPATEKSKKQIESDRLLKIYRSNLLTLTYQNLIYPNSAIDRGHEGKVLVEVTINRKGKVTELHFEKEAKYRSLNRAVEKAVSSASPFPAPPRKLKGKNLKIKLPITFALSG